MHTITARVSGVTFTYVATDEVATEAWLSAPDLRRHGINVVSVTPAVVHDGFPGLLAALRGTLTNPEVVAARHAAEMDRMNGR